MNKVGIILPDKMSDKNDKQYIIFDLEDKAIRNGFIPDGTPTWLYEFIEKYAPNAVEDEESVWGMEDAEGLYFASLCDRVFSKKDWDDRRSY